MQPRAKINLTLNILEKENNGYHNLESIFHTINLCDELYITKIDNNECEFNTNLKELNNDENIIKKSYNFLKENYGIGGCKIELVKHIPYEAGLGGGSSDCASFLIAINELYNLNLDKFELLKIGSYFGSDIDFFMYGGTSKVTGIGDVIKPIDTKVLLKLLLIKAPFLCSTPKMYKLFDKMKINQKNNNSNMIQSLVNNDIYGVANNLYNVFEEVIENQNELYSIKNLLISNGAISASLTGSGSVIYGLFDDDNLLNRTFNIAKEKYECYKCLTYNKKMY